VKDKGTSLSSHSRKKRATSHADVSTTPLGHSARPRCGSFPENCVCVSERERARGRERRRERVCVCVGVYVYICVYQYLCVLACLQHPWGIARDPAADLSQKTMCVCVCVRERERERERERKRGCVRVGVYV